ncbi:plastocyanin/azurin family copper-binding protein [Halomonas sp. SCS19]|uniref:cupredoxin domain-containing protein n=1 Tax=Halomonas sp. SCS19 TaxID=2950870 RepID=UPI0032DF759D
MRSTLMVVALGLLSTQALAGPGHAQSEAMDPDQADRTIAVEAGDIWFDPESLSVAPGEVVAFEVTNSGQLEHEFVIGSAEAQNEHRKMMREMASGGGHGMHGDGHDMSQMQGAMDMPAVTLAPGETRTLVWQAPEQGASLTFACNVPGHFEAGMHGTLSVGE